MPRGSGLSFFPLDWVLIDSWRVAGVPLEAVSKGIDGAFEKWRSRKTNVGWSIPLLILDAVLFKCATLPRHSLFYLH